MHPQGLATVSSMTDQPSVLRRAMSFLIDLVLASFLYVLGYGLLMASLATLGIDAINAVGGFDQLGGLGGSNDGGGFDATGPPDKPFEVLGLGSAELFFYGSFLAWGAVYLGVLAASSGPAAGQTWGQRVMGLRLVSVYGGPVGVGQTILRNLPLYALMLIGTWQFTKRVLPDVVAAVIMNSQSAFITMWVSIVLFLVPALLYAAFITVIGRGPTDMLAKTEIVKADAPVRSSVMGGGGPGGYGGAPASPYAMPADSPYAQAAQPQMPQQPMAPQAPTMPPQMQPPGV